jgi:hypothetical protein
MNNYNDEELLNWAMNQLYRAARTLQILSREDIVSTGCDLTAETILERLKKTKTGEDLIKKTNPQLLTQECPQKIKDLM